MVAMGFPLCIPNILQMVRWFSSGSTWGYSLSFPFSNRLEDPPFLLKQRDFADPSQHSGTYPSVTSECWHVFGFHILALLLLFEDGRRQFEIKTNKCNVVCCQEMLFTYF